MSEEYPDFIVTIEGTQYDCHPVCRQEYKNCYFETGYIDNHPIDPMYLLLSKDGKDTFIYLRPDECAAIAWVLNGLLWSNAMNEQQVPLLLTLAKDRKKLEIAVEALKEWKEAKNHSHTHGDFVIEADFGKCPRCKAEDELLLALAEIEKIGTHCQV
jgi:hypothetical protein